MEFLRMLEKIRTDTLTNIMDIISNFGQILFLIFIIAIIYWCIDKKLGIKLAVVTFISQSIVDGLKGTFRVKRPWLLDENFKPAFETDPNADYLNSFPSGHTQAATAMYSTIGMHSKKSIPKIICGILIALVGFSRMYLGAHTPKDVIVGFAVTIVISIIFNKICNKFFENEKDYTSLPLKIVIVNIIIFVIAFIFDKLGIGKDVVDGVIFWVTGSLGIALGIFIEKKYVNFNEKCSIIKQIIKAVVGLALYIGMFILAVVLGEDIPILTILFAFVMHVFVFGIYPMFFKKFFNKK